ncbi:MAG: hypothetical protein GY789_05295 [Hyphomicrobiales bacterium]|nr:hypothetical protein [Hyphomicrobiales bacterium]
MGAVPPQDKEFWTVRKSGREMLQDLRMKALFFGLFTALLLAGAGFAAINFGYQETPLPEETAVSVVERFYEYVSEAKIRGGNLLINEAYKLTSGDQSRTDQALFLGIVNRYPPGFKAEIIESRVQDKHAIVTIEYKMPSSFGGIYAVRTPVHLNLDQERNTWKLDFRGDTDDQDRESIAKTNQLEILDTASGGSNSKAKSQ